MPAPVAPLTDSELSGLLVAAPTRRAAAEELMRRHGEVVLAYAGVLCGDRRSAETLTVATFNQALDVFDRGPVPALTWMSCLVDGARQLAARWADDGRPDHLSPAFGRWLHHRQQGSARAGLVAALRTAESGCPLLRALHRLPEPAATEVWHTLLPVPGAGAPPAHPAPAGPVRQELAMAYLRERNSLVTERLCRHLAIRLADAASGGRAADPEMTGHLDGCEPCAGALADLRAVHHWDIAELQARALLGRWDPAPPEPSDAAAGDAADRAAPAAVGAEPRTPGHRRRRRSARHARRRRTAALWAAGLGTLTLACTMTPVLTTPDRAGDRRAVPTRPEEEPDAAPAPTLSAATAGGPGSSRPATPGPTPSDRPGTTSPTGSARSAPLHWGDSGEGVLTLQRLLSGAGCYHRGMPFVRGRFDEATVAALERFQRGAGIGGAERTEVSYGSATREVLEGGDRAAVCR
ncbi:peptidoglycan-binding protein [Kitasatospora sp. NPDC058201]|uniref:peptidoglycan-binding domain-containing protein n=3 Tax=Kitasatospora TaxID=2063 RepID=UPI0036538811